MKRIFPAILLIISFQLHAQKILPVIKANSLNAYIIDGNEGKIEWTLSPGVKPDIYACYRTRKAKWVIFHTDIDSIKIKIKPGSVYNFIVLLNGKDSCYTQLKSTITVDHKLLKEKRHDTIPFRLTAHHAICITSVLNDSDTLNLHFDTGSSGIRLTKEAILQKTKLLSNRTDVLKGTATAKYDHLNKVNKIRIGNMLFYNPVVLPTGFTSQGMDGRFGWDLFEGKIVEIDYDNRIMIVHSQLRKIKPGYKTSDITFYQSFPCIKGSFEIESKTHSGLFLLDTGSDLSIILDSSWVRNQNFPQNLTLIKKSTFKDPRGNTYENKIVLTPRFELNNFNLSDVPTVLLGSNNPIDLPVNFLGNDLLKRFNMILDFEKDRIYLKPNSLAAVPYTN